MDCPVCKNVQLLMSDRQGIEIDYCPNCRGVWLDRGELDKIIDRSAGVAPREDRAHQSNYPGQHRADDGYSQKHHGYPQQHKKKRESFLGELFDF